MIIAITFAAFSGESYANSNVNEVKNASEAYEKMNTQSQQQFMAGLQVSSIDISAMDLETALMSVQQERVRLLEEQLKNQINEVQKRNQKIGELSEKINVAKAELAEIRHAEGPLDKTQELEETINQLKRDMDAQSNSQQMDMLRLQSLSNKRQEAFDVMTNFIKKMQDNRSSIIENMR
ncbi:hypothetical protein KHA96_18670 [Bacillus sp. FJAT-49711]|uniref:hypothetical protein n=1 Tax=Bacillus sp. FJAT-49711 TaxID=2833585 RepID=UPI001BC8DF37|nr:hypothetical protein [Bacillus sp. FJAT-49711]MBS4220328.1 hypothetical protein [Bacillus sp. FJAT-49711]